MAKFRVTAYADIGFEEFEEYCIEQLEDVMEDELTEKNIKFTEAIITFKASYMVKAKDDQEAKDLVNRVLDYMRATNISTSIEEVK